jgi:hypothetical protein
MKIQFNLLLIAVFSLTAISCAPMERSVLHDQIANVGTLSTSASRRVVIVNSSFKSKEPYLESAFCAEPSPDIAEDIIASLTGKGDLSGGAETTGEIAKLQAQAKLELARNFQSVGQILFKRTQGAQFWRDGLFNLCQSYINGSIGKEQFEKKYYQLLEKSVELIKLEVPLMYKTQGSSSPKAADK